MIYSEPIDIVWAFVYSQFLLFCFQFLFWESRQNREEHQSFHAYVDWMAKSVVISVNVWLAVCKLTSPHSMPQMIQTRSYTFDNFSFRVKARALHDIFFFSENLHHKNISIQWIINLFFQSLFWAAVFGATHALEDSNNIWLSEPLALIMKFPTRDVIISFLWHDVKHCIITMSYDINIYVATFLSGAMGLFLFSVLKEKCCDTIFIESLSGPMGVDNLRVCHCSGSILWKVIDWPNAHKNLVCASSLMIWHYLWADQSLHEAWTLRNHYGKCPEISNTLFHTFLALLLLFIQMLLKILSGKANKIDPDQTALIWVCTVCTCHFVRNFGVRNFRALMYNQMA